MRYDRKQLSWAINQKAEEILDIKKRLRAPHQPERRSGDEAALRSHKAVATDLCALAAAIRGRVHLKGRETLLEARQRLQGLAETYRRKEVAQASVAA